MNYDSLVEWVEPFGPQQKQKLICRMTIRDAIDFWKEAHPLSKLTDQEVLDEFVIVHWATYVKEEA